MNAHGPGPTSDLGITGIVDAVEIGRGGFGVVYRAFQPGFRRSVAVKVLSMSAVDEGVRARFDRECQAIGVVSDHPNIVTVHESGYTRAGHPYLVMAYLSEGSLADRLASQGSLPPAETLGIGVKVAEALDAAHQAGVLHRDVKPSNILLSGVGEPQLADFGIARLTDATVGRRTDLAVSPAYAPPEVLGGRAPSAVSDVYSLAASLYELVAGRPAFVEDEDENVFGLLSRVAAEPIPDLRTLGVPGPAAAVIERAMVKDPAARTPSAAAFAAELRAAVEDLRGRPAEQVPAEPVPEPEPEPPSAPVPEPEPPSAPVPVVTAPGQRERRRRRVLTAVLVLVPVLVLLAVVLRPGGDGDGDGDGGGTPDGSSPELVVRVEGSAPWVATGLRLAAGDRVAVRASGTIRHDVDQNRSNDPDGDDTADVQRFNVVDGLAHGGLIGRVGTRGEPFALGGEASFTADSAGELFLQVNDVGLDSNDGEFLVKATVTRAT